MASVQSARIRPAFGGMNSESSPEYVPDNQAAVLENLLPRPGKVVLRGPISRALDTTRGTYTRMDGAQTNGNYIDFKTADSNGDVFNAGVLTGTAVTNPIRRYCTLNGLTYGTRGAGGTLRRWTPPATYTILTNGPSSPTDVVVHLSRLFVIESYILRWSDIGGSPLNLAAEWQDDVSGLVNQIVIGESDDAGVGLGHVGKQLAFFKERSIWMLTGLTPATFSVNRVTSQWGCMDVQSIIDFDDGCFFLGDRGFAFFDGSQVTDVSEDIKTELLVAIAAYKANVGSVTDLPFARAAPIGRDSIMLVIGSEKFSGTGVPPTINFTAIYDIRQRTWTKFSSDAFAIGVPVYFIPTPVGSAYAGATLGYDAAGNLLYLDGLVTPESAPPSVSGKDVVDSTTASITGVSYSRIIQLSSPGRTSQLKRLLLDYTFVVVSDADPSISGWSVSLVDGQGNVLLAPAAVDATILASGYTTAQRQAALIRKRFQVECFAEASEVQLRITLPALDSDVTEVLAAEIHDATIEFMPGRDRPTS